MLEQDKSLLVMDQGRPLPFVKPKHARTGPEAKASRNRRGRILIIEDELLVAENIKEMLQDAGYQVIDIVSSGEEAIGKFTSLNPDLVMMDIRLSGTMDGIQTATVIHHTLKEVPILFLSGYAEDNFPDLAGLKKSLFNYLTKPYHQTDVLTSVNHLLSLSKDENRK